MGDNLIAARQFTGLCQNNLSVLMNQEVPDTAKAVAALHAIQTQAKDLRARSIFRAAQSAIEEFHGVYSPSQRAGSLLTLNKLVRQYTEGLDEIAPIMPETAVGPSADEIATWNQVRDTFIPLHRFAKPGRELAALSALAGLSSYTPGDISNASGESFELLMPAISDESLRQARESDKSVSVSYATDDINMDEALANDVQDALIEICQGLVEGSVQAPSQRQTQGLSGAAHIAITAKRTDMTFDILISCEGPMPSENLLKGPKVLALKAQGAVFDLAGRENLVRVSIAELPISTTGDPVHLYDQALGMRA